MSFRTFSGGLPRRFRVVQQSFLHRDDLAFADVLSEQDIQAAFDAEGVTFRARRRRCLHPVRHVVGLLIAGGVQGGTSQLRGGRGARRGLDGRAAAARFDRHGRVLPCTRQVTGGGAGAAGRATGRSAVKKPCRPLGCGTGGTCIWWMGRHSVRRIHRPTKPPGPNPPAKSKAWASR